MPLVVVVHRPRCRDSTPDARRATKEVRYPADPPTVEEIVAAVRTAGHSAHGQRLRALIVVLWRAGLRIHEALAP